MQVSYNWLKEYVEIDLSAEALAEKMTNSWGADGYLYLCRTFPDRKTTVNRSDHSCEYFCPPSDPQSGGTLENESRHHPSGILCPDKLHEWATLPALLAVMTRNRSAALLSVWA